MLGVGKKVFDGGAVPTNVTLLEAPATGPNGIVYLRYGLAGGYRSTRSRCRARRLTLFDRCWWVTPRS